MEDKLNFDLNGTPNVGYLIDSGTLTGFQANYYLSAPDCYIALIATFEYLDSTGTYVDATGLEWVASFDTQFGIIVIDYPASLFYATYPGQTEYSFVDMKVTLTD